LGKHPIKLIPKSIFKGHTGTVNVLIISQDKKTLYSGSSDCTAKAYDIKTKHVIAT